MQSFFDTNILVYLFDTVASDKKRRAQSLFTAAAQRNEFVISTQVLQEFYVVSTRKRAVPLSLSEAEQVVRDLAQF
ncbi:MAG: PIN domain-containing protein [Gammaproteobacteria bacterium]|nr:PIN domain-containing protein [Gammaproteobacteria bacterium]